MKRSVSALGLLVVAAACSSSEPEPPAERTEQLVHLVTDAGTTGTRFCMFLSRKDYSSDGKTSCSEPREYKIFKGKDGKEEHCLNASSYDVGSTKLPVNATGGLQDLKDDPAKGRELVEKAVAQVIQNLSERRERKLSAAAVLGTAGFRDETGQTQEGLYADLWGAVRSVFESRQIPVVARTLLPEEEARFAWTTIRFLHLQNQAFSIIETGGKGCHFATGNADAEYKDITSASDPIGTARAWQSYAAEDVRQTDIPALKDPGFKACYSGKFDDPTGQDATACVAFLKARVFAKAAVVQIARQTQVPGDPRPLYGMGAAWNGLFRDYFPKAGSLTAKQIHVQATDECSRPQKNARGYIKHQSCFAISFQEAFLESTAGTDTPIRNGIESWPRGASVSPGGEFETCKGSTIKVTVEE